MDTPGEAGGCLPMSHERCLICSVALTQEGLYEKTEMLPVLEAGRERESTCLDLERSGSRKFVCLYLKPGIILFLLLGVLAS